MQGPTRIRGIGDLSGHLTASMLARRMGVSETTIYRGLRSGAIPALATPAGRLISPEVVERLMAERAASTEADS